MNFKPENSVLLNAWSGQANSEARTDPSRGREIPIMIDVKRAMLDPTSVFKEPEEVVASDELNRNQKIDILRQTVASHGCLWHGSPGGRK